MILPCYQQDKTNIIIHLKVIPNSVKNEVCGVITGANNQQFLKVKVTEIPDEGKANKALVKFLASEWGIAKSDIEIISGKSTRNKKIMLHSNKPLEYLKSQ